MRSAAVLAGGLSLALSSVAAGQQPAALRVSQARASVPAVTAFVEVVDPGGRPLTGLRADGFSAAVGSEPAVVKAAAPFAHSGQGVAYVFLVDVSRSLSTAEFAQIQQALALWIDGRARPGGGDRLRRTCALRGRVHREP
jgi:hypothetical protein